MWASGKEKVRKKNRKHHRRVEILTTDPSRKDPLAKIGVRQDIVRYNNNTSVPQHAKRTHTQYKQTHTLEHD